MVMLVVLPAVALVPILIVWVARFPAAAPILIVLEAVLCPKVMVPVVPVPPIVVVPATAAELMETLLLFTEPTAIVPPAPAERRIAVADVPPCMSTTLFAEVVLPIVTA